MRLREFTNLGPLGSKPGAPATKSKFKDVSYYNKSASFNPRVLKLQQELKIRGADLGSYGPDKDGLDGILGPVTVAQAKLPKFSKIAKKYKDVLGLPSSKVVGYNARSAGAGETGSASEALKFFISKGWTPAQAAGIVGNLQAESGSNLQIDALGDSGQGYGIAQWHPDRQAKFKEVMKKDIRSSNFKDQLEFVNWELNNSEANAGNMLKQAKTPEQAAAIVDQYYERSSGIHRDRRIANAQSLAPSTQVA